MFSSFSRWWSFSGWSKGTGLFILALPLLPYSPSLFSPRSGAEMRFQERGSICWGPAAAQGTAPRILDLRMGLPGLRVRLYHPLSTPRSLLGFNVFFSEAFLRSLSLSLWFLTFDVRLCFIDTVCNGDLLEFPPPNDLKEDFQSNRSPLRREARNRALLRG